MGNSVRLILLDADGCVFHDQNSYIQNPELDIPEWLIKSNRSLLAFEKKKRESKNYTKEIVASGSSRQSKKIDTNQEFGRIASPSFMPILPIFQSYLSEQIPSKSEVVLDPFLLADIYDNDPNAYAGKSYKAILQELYIKNASTRKHAESIFETHKIFLIYAWAHRTAQLNPDANEIVIDFYDDRNDILKKNYDFYNQHKDLLPTNVTIRYIHYSGQEPEQIYSITGEGETDKNYDWSLRYMAMKAKNDDKSNEHNSDDDVDPENELESSTKEEQTKIDPPKNITAADLVNSHENKEYPSDEIRVVKKNSEKYNFDFLSFDANAVEAFKDFKKIESHRLSTNVEITQKDTYTTAQKLHEENLIPCNLVPTSSLNLKLRNLRGKGDKITTFAGTVIEEYKSIILDDNLNQFADAALLAKNFIKHYVKKRIISAIFHSGDVSERYLNLLIWTFLNLKQIELASDSKQTLCLKAVFDFISTAENASQDIQKIAKLFKTLAENEKEKSNQSENQSEPLDQKMQEALRNKFAIQAGKSSVCKEIPDSIENFLKSITIDLETKNALTRLLNLNNTSDVNLVGVDKRFVLKRTCHFS